MRRTVLAMLLLTAAPAVAQDRPPMTPTRDVAITYRMTGGNNTAGAPQSMQVAWQAASGRMRSDVPGMGWMVADHRAGKGFMVIEQMRAVMDIPLGQAAQSAYSPTATFRREGNETIAGHSCTNWSYQDGPNQGRACVTADGVMLRAEGTRGGHSGGLEATAVQYGTQDPAKFERPAGYQAMQMPQGMPPGTMPPRR